MKIAIAAGVGAVMIVVALVFMYRMRHMPLMYRISFALYLIGQVLAAAYLFALVIKFEMGMPLFASVVVFGLLSIPVDFALYHVLSGAVKQHEAKERVRLLEEQHKALDAQQQELDAEAQRARDVRDEILSELDKVMQQLDASPDDEASADFDRVLELVDSTGRRVCRHHVVGALLASKEQEAASQGIRVDFDLDVPEGLLFTDTELCAVFSNLFDNAVNACRQLPEGEGRFIDMRAYSRSAFFVVDMSNGCPRTSARSPRRAGLLDEHGWGLSIVRTVAERHGGMLEAKRQGDRFHTVVVLGLGK